MEPLGSIDKIEKGYQRYHGRYVIINPQGRPTSVGRLINIEDGFALLSPHLGQRYHPKKGVISGLTRKVERINLIGTDITPTTERSVRAYAKYKNAQNNNKNGKEKSKD